MAWAKWKFWGLKKSNLAPKSAIWQHRDHNTYYTIIKYDVSPCLAQQVDPEHFVILRGAIRVIERYKIIFIFNK